MISIPQYLLCKQDIDRSPNQLHHHRKGTAISCIFLWQLMILLGVHQGGSLHWSCYNKIPHCRERCKTKVSKMGSIVARVWFGNKREKEYRVFVAYHMSRLPDES